MLESVTGPAFYTHKMTSDTPDAVNQHLRRAMETGNPKVRSRIGVGDAGDEILWLPWQSHVIKEPSALFQGLGDQSGHNVSLETADPLWAMRRLSKTASRKGLISKMVAEIAAENGMDSVVEPTAGEYLFIQSYQDDVSFIRNRLLDRAVSEDGHGNFLFYVKDNALHFHTPDYQADTRDYSYLGQASDLIAHVDSSQNAFMTGGSGTLMVAVDPFTGQSRELSSRPDQALTLGNTLPDYSAVGLPLTELRYHLGANNPSEAAIIGQNVYERERMKTYTITLHAHRTLGLRVNDFVNLTIDPKGHRASPWSGVWLLTSLAHTVSKGALTSEFTLQRGELQTSRGDFTALAGQGVDVVSDSSVAPGRTVNVKEVSVSRLIKGAAGSTLTEVQDPNKAPTGQ